MQNIEFPDCSLFLIFAPLHIKYDNGCGSNENGSNNNKFKDNGSNGNGSNYNGSNDECIWVANIHRAGAGEPCARREYLVPLTLSEIATMTSEWAEGMFVLCKSCFPEQAPEAGGYANSHRGEREHRDTGETGGKGDRETADHVNCIKSVFKKTIKSKTNI